MIKVIQLEKIIGRFVEEASVIYPSREFRIIEKDGEKLIYPSGGRSARVNVAVDKEGRITSVISYG